MEINVRAPERHDLPVSDLIASRSEAPNHVPVIPNVIGVDELLAKKSAVDSVGTTNRDRL